MRFRGTVKRHIYQNGIPQPSQFRFSDIMIDLGELCDILGIYHMFLIELGSVAEESIGDEQRNIIAPAVSRGGGKKNPSVASGDPQKAFHPYAVTDHPLFVKYKEGVPYIRIFLDVVPAVNDYLISIWTVFFAC